MSEEEYIELLYDQVDRLAKELRDVCVRHQVEDGAFPEAVMTALVQGAAITAVMVQTLNKPEVSEEEAEAFFLQVCLENHERAWEGMLEFMAHHTPESEAVH